MCPTGSSVFSTKEMVKSNFREAFEVLDSDRDGKISSEDLRSFYSGISSTGDDDDDDIIKTMMSVADSNKNGYVEFDEFERVLNNDKKKKKKNGGGVMEDVFRVMDKDGDGRLSFGDLKSYMNLAGFSATDDDIKAMIKLGGGDDEENQGVSFDGLVKILALDSSF